MKVVFFGTPEFAVATLQRLLESKHEVVAVVTQPDKPSGRGLKITPPPVKVLAEKNGIPVHQPLSVKKPEFHETFRSFGADVAVVVAYGRILPKALLDIPKFGFLNVHASLLPRYRGAAPIQWAIVRGEKVTGVTIMQIDEGLDTGPMIATRVVDILEDDDARSVHDILSFTGAEAMVEVLDQIEDEGRVVSRPQDDAEATHAPLIQRIDAKIDWNRPSAEIIWLVRGFVAWPGAYARHKDEDVKILGIELADPLWTEVPWQDEAVPRGIVVDILKTRGLLVKCGDGLVLVTRLKFPGKREMDADSAVNGGLVDVGFRFE